MAINKVIYGGNTLIDLTGDTVTAADVASGVTFHDKSGTVVEGTNTFDSDTSGDTATAAEILATKTAHARGTQLTGTMPNRGAISETISDKDDEITVPAGYHDGSGKVSIDATEKAKLIAANIRQGITILSVTGSMTGTEGVTAQTKNVTPATTAQQITPDTGYNYLSQVNVAAIPYSESANAAGGVTVTIAGA